MHQPYVTFPFLFRNVSLNMKAESYVIDQLCNMANSTRKLEGHSFFMSSQKSNLSTNSETTNSEYTYMNFSTNQIVFDDKNQ